MAGHFNWLWHDATTFEAYIDEIYADMTIYKSFGANEAKGMQLSKGAR